MIETLLIVGVVLFLVYRFMYEGFQNPSTKVDVPCPQGYVKCPSGDCRLKTDIYNPCH